jgi:hypothetical protein
MSMCVCMCAMCALLAVFALVVFSLTVCTTCTCLLQMFMFAASGEPAIHYEEHFRINF